MSCKSFLSGLRVPNQVPLPCGGGFRGWDFAKKARHAVILSLAKQGEESKIRTAKAKIQQMLEF